MLSDEQLVARAQKGDQLAADAVVVRFTGLAYSIAGSYSTPITSHDDMRQEALHGLFAAMRDFRPGLGTSFKTFAGFCVRRWIWTVIKTDTREKRHSEESPLFLDKTVSHEFGDMPMREAIADIRVLDACDAAVANDDLGSLLAFIACDLTELERECLLAVARGDSYADLGRRFGWGKKRVDNAVQRARRRCHQFVAEREAA